MTPIRDEFDRWLEGESPSLRKHWDAPELWPRIAGSLEAERTTRRGASGGGRWAAAAAVLFLLAPAVYWLLNTPKEPPPLLTESALEEVREAETVYARSIDDLAKLAAPRIASSPSPLIASYREKLLLLDDAIAALKDESGRNPYNHHLRKELLALYREKRATLEGVLRENPNSGATP